MLAVRSGGVSTVTSHRSKLGAIPDFMLMIQDVQSEIVSFTNLGKEDNLIVCSGIMFSLFRYHAITS